MRAGMAEKRPARGRNDNLRGPVTSESRRPADLASHGKAGVRVLIDEMLESRHGRPREEWVALGRAGLEMLHLLASGEESHHFRNRAIGAVGLIANPASV